MKRFLSQVIERKENGLYFCRFPTGFGKSYNVREVIKDLLKSKDDRRKIIYLTPLKKNLPKELQESDDVLILRSNLDQVTDILPSLDVPESFKSESYMKVMRLVGKLKAFKDNNAIDNDYKHNVEKELIESESAFRRELRAHLNKTFPNKRARMNAVITDKQYKWIGELYPAVFTENKRAIIMTMKKFLGKNSVIIDRSYDFITSELTEGAIIFIDEFDSTKAELTDHIIDRALSVSNEYLSLFKSVLFGLDAAKMPINLNKSLTSRNGLSEKFDELIALGKALVDEYKLNLSYKMEDDSVDRRQNFLFNDGGFHTILEKGKQYIAAAYNRSKNTVVISAQTKADYYKNHSDSDLSIFSMLRDIRAFLSRFRTVLYNWAESYRTLINSQRKPNSDEMTTENALSSILYQIGISELEQKLLLNECCHISNRPRSIIPERSYYTNGYEIFEFEDSDEHNETTRMNYIKVYDTPEKMIRYLSEKSMVFAISATADLPTVFGNYDLAYLKQVLGPLYHEQDDNLSLRIEDGIRKTQKVYEDGRIRIHTKVIDTQSRISIRQRCEAFLSPDNAKTASQIINNVTDDEYAAVRYCSILQVMHSFFEHKEIHALLCLQNALPSEKDTMSEKVFRSLFSLAASDRNGTVCKDELCILRSNNFDMDKQRILDDLSKGKRRFVMSSYSTIGAGQNLQYKVSNTDGYIELCEHNESDPRTFSADFDALYLGQITNLTINTYADGRISKEDMMKMLFQTESLYYNGELSYNDKAKMIKLAFNSFSNSIQNNPNLLYKTESLRNYATLLSIQAVGRICRAFLKRPDIYLYADNGLLSKLNASLLNRYSVSPEMEAIVKECELLCSTYTVNENRTLNIAERISTDGMRIIRQMLSRNWTEQSMRLWNELRETVLKYPTADRQAKDNNEVINKLYITSGEPTNKYVYSQYSDFDNVAIDFNCDVIGFMNSERAKMKGEGEEHIVLTMSQEDSGLPLLMRYMPLKEFFISMGYAIEFERNEYVMSPVLFHNIYKGALGEAAGRFILRNERGIELSEITDPQKFEFFDFELAPDVYVDFKNWKYTYIQDKEKTRAEILNKLDAIGGKRAYIINMTDTHNSKPCISHDGRIIEIPRLIDNNGHVDAKMLDLIKEEE